MNDKKKKGMFSIDFLMLSTLQTGILTRFLIYMWSTSILNTWKLRNRIHSWHNAGFYIAKNLCQILNFHLVLFFIFYLWPPLTLLLLTSFSNFNVCSLQWITHSSHLVLHPSAKSHPLLNQPMSRKKCPSCSKWCLVSLARHHSLLKSNLIFCFGDGSSQLI